MAVLLVHVYSPYLARFVLFADYFAAVNDEYL